jgi:hypothetical protein
MNLIALITGLFQIVTSLTKLFEQNKLIEAGEARAVAKGTGEVLDELRRAKAARARLRDPSWRARLRKKFQARK